MRPYGETEFLQSLATPDEGAIYEVRMGQAKGKTGLALAPDLDAWPQFLERSEFCAPADKDTQLCFQCVRIRS